MTTTEALELIRSLRAEVTALTMRNDTLKANNEKLVDKINRKTAGEAGK